jgi:hypothetical protein
MPRSIRTTTRRVSPASRICHCHIPGCILLHNSTTQTHRDLTSSTLSRRAEACTIPRELPTVCISAHTCELGGDARAPTPCCSCCSPRLQNASQAKKGQGEQQGGFSILRSQGKVYFIPGHNTSSVRPCHKCPSPEGLPDKLRPHPATGRPIYIRAGQPPPSRRYHHVHRYAVPQDPVRRSPLR